MNLRQISPSKYTRFFLLGILALIIFSMCRCSCDYHISRLEKKCGKSWNVDTAMITVIDTIPEYRKDTLFATSKDTIYLREGKTTVKYFYNTVDKTNYLSLNKPPEIKYKVVPFVYKTTEVSVDYFPAWLKWVVFIVIGLFVLLTLVRYFGPR